MNTMKTNRKITEIERQFILENKDKMTIAQIAEKLGRENTSIRAYCVRNHIEITQTATKGINDEEKQFILENKNSMYSA